MTFPPFTRWLTVPRTCYTSDGKPKRRFKTRQDARRFLVERDIAYKQEPYACHACGWWHVRTSHD